MRTSTFQEALPGERLRSPLLAAIGYEHGIPLLIYGLCTLVFTWPTVQNFMTGLVSLGGDDPRHNLWLLWHVKEALLGHQNWYHTNLVYYPHGISLLMHGLGPVTGFFALPFWPWGLEAAHNGAVLVGFGLTGYLMYLLARGLGFRWEISIFAGLMLIVAPMHLVGLYGHMTKVFLGLIPLAFLALQRTLDLQRTPFWVIGTLLALLLVFLHHGHQFVFVSLSIPVFIAVAYWQAGPKRRQALLKRSLLLALGILIVVGPLLLAIQRTAGDPRIVATTKLESTRFRPDVAELILPPYHSRLFGSLATQFLSEYNVSPNLETAVFLSWVGLFLGAIALLKKEKAATVWIILTLMAIVLALGPSLQVLGQDAFTDFELPIIMPYALITEVPGLGFIRTPGRFMMLGAVTLTIAASYGLAWLVQRFPQQARIITATAIILLLLENWPRPWPQETLRPIPDFYRQIAADQEMYGVLDLPIKPEADGNHTNYSAHYQMYQTVHGKGIATAYISRPYVEHPLFPCLIPDFRPAAEILFVNGEPSKCFANILDDLTRANYRYVVWHQPQEHYPNYKPGSWGEQATADFIYQVFGEQPPLVEDELVSVYLVPGVATEDLTLAMSLGNNWYRFESSRGHRWAASPATITVASPAVRQALLEITPNAIHVKGHDDPLGDSGHLQVTMDDGFSTTVTIKKDETTVVPLTIPPGRHTITLTLEAGNFSSSNYSSASETQLLSFAVRSINLEIVIPLG